MKQSAKKRQAVASLRPRKSTTAADRHEDAPAASPSAEPLQDTGFLLVDLNLTPVYTNSAAIHILSYAHEWTNAQQWELSVQESVRSILQVEALTTGSLTTDFPSGRRRYLCRSFLLESREGGSQPQMVALLLERPPRNVAQLRDLSRRYRLSHRERETVQHLTCGLTTKEVAERMNISPNTVKKFVRLIMCKMGVNTRSGIVGKLISR